MAVSEWGDKILLKAQFGLFSEVRGPDWGLFGGPDLGRLYLALNGLNLAHQKGPKWPQFGPRTPENIPNWALRRICRLTHYV